MKTRTNQAKNKINIVGKLLDITFRSGEKNGRKYESANMTVRVTQTYGGREETSEVPVGMFASPFTKEGKPNPAWEQLQALKSAQTAQNVGIDNADTVRITSGSLRENNFISKSGQLVHGWQINTSFINTGTTADVASFDIEIFIMDMYEEMDKEGDPTGRLIIKGGIVQYGGNLDVIEFIVEQPEAVDYISRNWNQNDTVNIKGRVRMAVTEEKVSGAESSWGEDIPSSTSQVKRELIITGGSDDPYDEDFAYDPVEIKKAFNERKARIGQLQEDAKNKAKSSTAPTTTSNKYDWE